MNFTRYELFKIKHELDLIERGSDFGYFFINKLARTIYLELGDGDKVDISALKQKLPKNIDIVVEAEYGPEDEDNWLLVSRGIESCEAFSYNILTGVNSIITEVNPQPLSPQEYANYYRFYKTLKV